MSTRFDNLDHVLSRVFVAGCAGYFGIQCWNMSITNQSQYQSYEQTFWRLGALTCAEISHYSLHAAIGNLVSSDQPLRLIAGNALSPSALTALNLGFLLPILGGSTVLLFKRSSETSHSPASLYAAYTSASLCVSLLLFCSEKFA
jgi:hypothetical protein